MTNHILIDNSTHDDEFERRVIANALVEFLINEDEGDRLVLGVYGPWGSGKTEFLKMMRDQVVTSLDEDLTKIVWFDSWLHHHRSDIAVSLLYKIVEAAEADATSYEEKVARKKLKTGILKRLKKLDVQLSIPGVTVTGNIGELADPSSEDSYSPTLTEQFLEQLGTAITEWVGDDGRLFVFVDDIDRCLPDQMLRVLEGLQLYLKNLPMTAILAVDKDAVRRAVEERYPHSANGYTYIDKIVDVGFDLPAISPEQLSLRYTKIVGKLGIHGESIEHVFQIFLDQNPRNYEKLFNSIVLHRAAAFASGVAPPWAAMPFIAFMLVLKNHLPRTFDKALNDFQGFLFFIHGAELGFGQWADFKGDAVNFLDEFNDTSGTWHLFRMAAPSIKNILFNAVDNKVSDADKADAWWSSIPEHLQGYVDTFAAP